MSQWNSKIRNREKDWEILYKDILTEADSTINYWRDFENKNAPDKFVKIKLDSIVGYLDNHDNGESDILEESERYDDEYDKCSEIGIDRIKYFVKLVPMTSGIEYVVFTVRVKDPFVYGNIRENPANLLVRDRLAYRKPLDGTKSLESDEDLVYCQNPMIGEMSKT